MQKRDLYLGRGVEMNAVLSGSEVEQSTVQLIIDQLEELVVTLIEEVRERPAVAVAILAGIVGAVIGGMFASGMGRPKPARKRAAARADAVGDVVALLGLGYKLLENPIVRSYTRAAIAAQLRKRFSV
jgi:uncharacterized membrane protein YeaQ/YmgE (transglycosylase-associated protein family)